MTMSCMQQPSEFDINLRKEGVNHSEGTPLQFVIVISAIKGTSN